MIRERATQRPSTTLLALLRGFAKDATTVSGIWYSSNRATIGCRTLWALLDTDNPATNDVLQAIHAERWRRLSAATRGERQS